MINGVALWCLGLCTLSTGWCFLNVYRYPGNASA